MMRKLLTFMVVMLMVGYVFGQVKIGVINPEKVIKNTTRGKASIKKLDELGKAKQSNIVKMQNEIKALQKELQSPALSSTARETKSMQLQDKQTKLRRYIEDSRREFQVKYQKEMEDLRKEIMPLIAKIGKAQNFTLIMDIGTSGIAYFDQAIDVTDLVIKEYNIKYPAKK